LWHIYRSYRINAILVSDFDLAWSNVKSIWGRSKIIYRGPVGFPTKIKFEYAILENFISKYPKCEPTLIAALLDPNPYICGYSLVALEKLHSAYLSRLPRNLLNREEEIEWKLAARRGRNKLGLFAKIHKQF
jgi:hypothetical protein